MAAKEVTKKIICMASLSILSRTDHSFGSVYIYAINLTALSLALSIQVWTYQVLIVVAFIQTWFRSQWRTSIGKWWHTLTENWLKPILWSILNYTTCRFLRFWNVGNRIITLSISVFFTDFWCIKFCDLSLRNLAFFRWIDSQSWFFCFTISSVSERSSTWLKGICLL